MGQETTNTLDTWRGKYLTDQIKPNELENVGGEKSTRIVYRIYTEDVEGNGEVAILPAEVSCVSTSIVPDFDKAIGITEVFRHMDNALKEAKIYNPKAQNVDDIQRSIYDLQTDDNIPLEQKLAKLGSILADVVRAYGVEEYLQVEPGHYSKSINSKFEISRVIGIEDSDEELEEGDEEKPKQVQKVFSFNSDMTSGDMMIQDGDYMEGDDSPVFDVNNGFAICGGEIVIGTKITKQSCAVALAVYASTKNGNIEPAKVREIAKNLLKYDYFKLMRWQRDGSINTTELNSKLKTLKSLAMNLQRSKKGELPPEPS